MYTARFILQIRAKYFSMYTKKLFNIFCHIDYGTALMKGWRGEIRRFVF